MDAVDRLRLILRASAVYDWLALLLLLWMPDALLRLFDHPVPADAFLFRLAALPLWMAPFVYWTAASHPRTVLVPLSITLRVVGAVGIAALVLWHRPAGSAAYWTFVGADLAWAAAIAAGRRPRSERESGAGR